MKDSNNKKKKALNFEASKSQNSQQHVPVVGVPLKK